MTTGTLAADPFELAYTVEGQGRPVFVIGSAVYYPRTFSAALRRELQLVFADHRGFARATGPYAPADYTLDRVIEDMALVRERLGLEKMVVVGHSGHGFLALEYAKRYPAHVSHVVMIASRPSNGPVHAALTDRHWHEAVCPERKALQDAEWARLPDDLAAEPDRRFITFCLRMGPRSWYDAAFDAAPLWADVPVTMPVMDHLWGEAFRDLAIEDGLEALGVPVLLALGRHDYLVGPASAWDPYRERFQDLTVKVFDRSSHTPQLEESALFDAELLSWLASRPAAP
ncbi:MAG: alpha/beta fold hydrolase [Candidatus Sericytochromatia bacterium]